ncbi:hypothetical protein PCE1_002559 [Barthelona sp. PCE]
MNRIQIGLILLALLSFTLALDPESPSYVDGIETNAVEETECIFRAATCNCRLGKYPGVKLWKRYEMPNFACKIINSYEAPVFEFSKNGEVIETLPIGEDMTSPQISALLRDRGF